MKTFTQFISEKHIINDNGILKYDWKTDLESEEYEGYLPDGVIKVLELKLIKSKIEGKKQGTKLFNAFKKTKEYKEADAIFLDPNPDQGETPSTNATYDDIMNKLISIYKSWGFINNSKSQRMWIFKDSSIKGDNIPK